MTTHPVEAIVIGGSAGSLDVLLVALPALPADFALPIAIVLHLAPTGPSLVAQVLAERCRLPVREVEDKEPIVPGTIYVAPPNYHLLIERHRAFALTVDEPVRFSRPSIDVCFASAADAYGPAVAGLLLSGANDDGVDGLARIVAAGGVALVQDPASASSPTMPQAALRRLDRAARAIAVPDLAPVFVELADATLLVGDRR